MSAALAALLDPALPGRTPDRPVAGYVGADVPVELLTAAGYHPRRLSGSPHEDASAGRRYLGGGLDPVACSVLTRLLAGSYGPLDVLVVSRDCEASLRLFYVLRELRRVEPSVALPPLHLVDVLHLPHRTTTRYVLAKVRGLRAWLAERSGRPVGDDALAAAVVAHDRVRALLRATGELRPRRRLTGTEFLGVVDAATALLPDRAAELLGALVAELADRDPRSGLPVHLTGSAHDCPDVYAAVEAGGLLVVGEDHDRGDLLAATDVGDPGDPAGLELALAERYQHNGPAAPRASIAERAAHTAARVRSRDAAGLLGYVREHDDGPPWDWAAQRAAAGVPAALLERQPYGRVDPDALDRAVRALRAPAVAA
ncbi:Benzoyl-CoA reductase/2-hydroxyglutaryl-CoA dehydratase subunit, BcrC/BadD/HgdB [Pseudonocardia ammonioxydans]|uniref:Benzoyl-CoA reductase/2-hydroxyglutaryl-CoA dehydratase subunit, BcrC/BadD/HgdB n=1 Tax=Pseudonocardia ammonioxydans TaxID=260086 RepID=A0A1I4YHA9_PSUAM|nr:2-hydroxyacyl-CoA dehydratase family protein [Pseudonocardia ammonioxydans]SFN37396.1 Benzoyl-CoA reductase/2-hydroxyglutaryl-CoA dehydratase subunit, BcrC/BadD/HgdB [Pseudonocardia ammonioxydans]